MDPCQDVICLPTECNLANCVVNAMNIGECVPTPQEDGTNCYGGTCQQGQCNRNAIRVSSSVVVYVSYLLVVMMLLVVLIL